MEHVPQVHVPVLPYEPSDTPFSRTSPIASTSSQFSMPRTCITVFRTW